MVLIELISDFSFETLSYSCLNLVLSFDWLLLHCLLRSLSNSPLAGSAHGIEAMDDLFSVADVWPILMLWELD